MKTTENYGFGRGAKGDRFFRSVDGKNPVIYDEKINSKEQSIPIYQEDGEKLSLCQPTIIFALVTIKPSKWYTASMKNSKPGVNCAKWLNAIPETLQKIPQFGG